MDSVQTTSHFQGELDKDVPFLFVLAVELLACKIRQDKELEGIKIFRKELKISQFADDTTLLNSNKNSVSRALNVLGSLSGLRLLLVKNQSFVAWSLEML